MVHNFGLWRQWFDMLDIYILPSKPNIQVKAPLPSPHPSEVQDRFSVLIINLVCPRCWAGLHCREIIYTIYSIYSIYTIYTILLLSTLPTLCTRSYLQHLYYLKYLYYLQYLQYLYIYKVLCRGGAGAGYCWRSRNRAPSPAFWYQQLVLFNWWTVLQSKSMR